MKKGKQKSMKRSTQFFFFRNKIFPPNFFFHFFFNSNSLELVWMELNVETIHRILTISLSDTGLLKSKKSVTADEFFFFSCVTTYCSTADNAIRNKT